MKFGSCALTVALCVSAPAASAEDPVDFALNVSRHVLLHELAHALIREFDLPVLGNEETVADAFATVTIAQTMRNDAAAILKARARSWLHEASEVAPEDYDLKGEHELDARRAYRTICLLYGTDPTEWEPVIRWIWIEEQDADDCSDIAPDVIDGWQSVLAPHRLPAGETSPNVIVRHGEAPFTDTVRAAGLLEEVAAAVRHLDWPHPVVLHYDSCGGEGASWSRTERRILLCDEYFARFVRQATVAPPS